MQGHQVRHDKAQQDQRNSDHATNEAVQRRITHDEITADQEREVGPIKGIAANRFTIT